MTDAPPNPFAEHEAGNFALPAAFVDNLQTPALLVDLDRVRRNVQRMLAYAGGADRWRPHLKTTKLREVWAELLAAGLRHLKCATTREASVLLEVAANAGTPVDLLVAYPLRGPGLRRLAALAAAADTATLSVLVEDAAAVGDVPPAIGVFVDINLGMNRTGVPIADAATITAIASAAGARFRGLHCYDGHQHDPDLDQRRQAIFAGYEQVCALTRHLAANGVAVGDVITAGTPAFRHALAFPGFVDQPFTHRISPGTVVYHDARSEIENPDVELEPAAVVLARVISQPTPDIVTCDAGSKSLAAEAGDPCACAIGHGELQALTPSEEHLPLRVLRGTPPARGQTLLLVPRHVCPTVNLAEAAVLLEAGRPPRIVPVAARAHELLL